jgi:serine protease
LGVISNAQLNLFIVRVFNDSGEWTFGSDLVAAAQECVNAGANVISMSLSRAEGPGMSEKQLAALSFCDAPVIDY